MWFYRENVKKKKLGLRPWMRGAPKKPFPSEPLITLQYMKPPYTRFEFRQLSIYVASLDAVTGACDYQSI